MLIRDTVPEDAKTVSDLVDAVARERVELEVFRSNERAVRLYEAHGFVREGARVGARRLGGSSGWSPAYPVAVG